MAVARRLGGTYVEEWGGDRVLARSVPGRIVRVGVGLSGIARSVAPVISPAPGAGGR
jgi:hypothetical protein